MADSGRRGKAAELRCQEHFLTEDWDVYAPLLDRGYDSIVTRGETVFTVQCKGRFSGQEFDQPLAWRGHPAPELMYLDNGNDWWVVPYGDFARAAGKPKWYSPKSGGRYHGVSQPRARKLFGKFFKETGIRRLSRRS